MLNEWLNDLAQEEHEKTASAQFEAVLKDMDIPELRAFLALSHEKTAQYPEAVQQSVRPVDVAAARAERAGTTRAGFGVLGGAAGGGLGMLGGAALTGGHPAGVVGGGLAGLVGGGYLGHKLSKGHAERGAAAVPDETYQALSDTDVAERLYDSGRISRRELQAAYDAAGPALMAGKEDPRDAAEYDRMRAAGISASDMAPYPYAEKTSSSTLAKEAEAMFAAADQAGRSLARSMAKLAEDPAYRSPTSWERWMLPEGRIGEAIPLDPRERSDRYLDKTRWTVPAQALASGGLGAIIGSGGLDQTRARLSGKGALLGAGIGALAGTGAQMGVRHLAARGVKNRAEEEALTRPAPEKTASFRGAIQKLAAEGRLRTFEKIGAMSANDTAKVQAVSDAMKKTKGMSLQQRKQVMKGVGKSIPGGK